MVSFSIWSALPDLNRCPADALSNLRSLLAELAGEALASLSSGDASAARLLLSVLAEVDS